MNYPSIFIEYCKTQTLRFTSLRKQVLYLLWCTEKPLKAYEMLELLVKIKPNAQPSALYRVLDYFVTMGIVHKIDSLQSYVLCQESNKKQALELLMVCHKCSYVQEIVDISMQVLGMVQKIVKPYHFQLSQDPIELSGICQNCKVSEC